MTTNAIFLQKRQNVTKSMAGAVFLSRMSFLQPLWHLRTVITSNLLRRIKYFLPKFLPLSGPSPGIWTPHFLVKNQILGIYINSETYFRPFERAAPKNRQNGPGKDIWNGIKELQEGYKSLKNSTTNKYPKCCEQFLYRMTTIIGFR